ncbi:MAG: DUF4293 domain-containing protein [Bacteroidaceae bacterium]|nr:DUF4293 domain-containing protein [Bacteroidaceae bacterium]
MIQRIQTVYLLLVAILSFTGLLSQIGTYTLGEEVVATFSNFTFTSYGPCATYQSAGPYALGVLLLMVIFLSIVSIMLFRKRMRQLRLCIFSSILLVGYIVVYALFAYFYKENLDQVVSASGETAFRLRFVTVFPVLSLILNTMAIHGIRKDEALVRSLDRLR